MKPKSFHSILIILIFLAVGCAAITAKPPTYKTTAGLTFHGDPVPFLIPSDIPDFTIHGPVQGGYISLDIAYLFFLIPDSDAQYVIIVMANCPIVLALMVVDGEKVRNWIYNSKGEPIQAGEAEMKVFLGAEHKCPPKQEHAS
jgi:hypothetical protein